MASPDDVPCKRLRTSPFLSFRAGDIVDRLTGAHWVKEASLVELLHCAVDGRTREEFVAEGLDEATIACLLEERLLVEADEVWYLTNITHLELEVSAHCNWRCEFCPVSIDPKPKASMAMSLFAEILDKAIAHRSIQYVTFNSYNEPLLDVFFEDRVRLLAATRLKLQLHTNGSVLTEATIRLLADSKVLSFIMFNLPAVTRDAFKQVTGSPSLTRTLENLDAALSAGLPVALSIQGTDQELRARLPEFSKRYRAALESPWTRIGNTSDRAGVLTNRFGRHLRIVGRLRGCELPLNWLHIGVNGNCFVCCEDYYQRHEFGNIRDGTIEGILRSDAALKLRKAIFGDEDAPADFICRSCLVMQKSSQDYNDNCCDVARGSR